MNLKKTYYLNNQIQEYFNKEENIDNFSQVEKKILDILLSSLNESEKYIFSEDFSLYLDEMEDFYVPVEVDKIYNNFKIKPNNISVEYVEEIIDSKGELKSIENIIQILDRRNSHFNVLFEILPEKIKNNLEAKILFYYRKDYLSEHWSIPVKTIIVYEDGTKQSIDLFSKQAFEMNNNLQAKDQQDSLGQFIEGLFDLFNDISRIIGNPKIEFLYIPPSIKKNKRKRRKRPTYGYRLAHIFIKKPEITLRTNQGAFQHYKFKKKGFSDSIKNLRKNLFLKNS